MQSGQGALNYCQTSCHEISVRAVHNVAIFSSLVTSGLWELCNMSAVSRCPKNETTEWCVMKILTRYFKLSLVSQWEQLTCTHHVELYQFDQASHP